MTVFELSIIDFVHVAEITKAIGYFLSIPASSIHTYDDFFSQKTYANGLSVGIRVQHSDTGFRSLIDIVTSFDYDDLAQLSLADFLAKSFNSYVAIGDFMLDQLESTGRYLVVDPIGDCRCAIEISNGEIFDLQISPEIVSVRAPSC